MPHSKQVEKKAIEYYDSGKIKQVSNDRGHYEFEVNGHAVYRTAGGEWSCNAKVIEEIMGQKVSKGCVIFGKEDRDCSHILACKIYLLGYKGGKNNGRKTN